MEILKKSKMKVPADDDSHYKTIYAENSADNVKFSDTTLETVLNSLNGGKIPHADNVNFAEKAEKDSAGNKIVDYYLPINNAAMSGTPTAPTYAGTDTTVNQLCTCEYFNGLVRKVAGNIDSDMTLAKLIASINKDPNFATNAAVSLGNKQNKNSNLTALMNLDTSNEGIIYSVNSDTFATSPISGLGFEMMSGSISNLRNVLQLDAALKYFDETEEVDWLNFGNPSVSTSNAKFNKALQCSAGNFIYSKQKLTFGGNPFTVDFWLYVSSAASNGAELIISTDGDKGAIKLRKRQRYGTDGSCYLKINNSSGSQIVNDSVFDRYGPYDLDKNIHVEISYNGSTVFLFIDGVLRFSANCAVERLARTVNLGSSEFIGTISSFRLLDGVCQHTANFTPPTAVYDLTDKTVSLLQF